MNWIDAWREIRLFVVIVVVCIGSAFAGAGVGYFYAKSEAVVTSEGDFVRWRNSDWKNRDDKIEGRMQTLERKVFGRIGEVGDAPSE